VESSEGERRRWRRRHLIGAVAVAALVFGVNVASGDDIGNTVQNGNPDATFEVLDLSPAGAKSNVGFWVRAVNGDGENNCNIDSGETFTIEVSSSNSAVAAVEGLVTPSNRQLTFTGCAANAGDTANIKSVAIDPVSQGTATITVSIVANTTGSGTFATNTASFTVNVDDPPSVTSTSPSGGATGVAVNSAVTVNFSEQVANDAAFSLECPAGTPRTFTTSGSSASSYTLTPSANLPNNTTCTVIVNKNKITDTDFVDGPDKLADNYSFTFTTVAAVTDTAPSVSSTVPANGATNIAIADSITVTFSEPVNVIGTWFTLTCNSVAQAATASGGPTTFTIDPTANLPKGANCTFTVVAGQVADADGNDPPDNMTANFTTGFGTQANRVPTADAGGPYSVNEGSSVTVSATGSDADGDTLTYAWDLDDNGSYETAGQSVSFDASALDGPSSHTIKVQATDTDGATGTGTATVNVVNVPPTAAITGAPPSSPEGTAITVAASVSDPAPADTFTYAWSVTKDGGAYASGTASTFSFAPDDNGTYVVDLTVTDDDGGSGVALGKTITVTNVDPTAAITGAPVSGPEGTAISLGSSITDPSSVDTAAGFTKLWSVTKNGSPFGSTGTGATFSFTPDDNGTYVVSLSATDKDGGNDTDSKTITVTNVDPAFTAANAATNPTKFGATASCAGGTTLLYGFTDPGADTWTIEIDWDNDGTFEDSDLNVSKTGSYSHTYLTAGSHTAAVKVTDDDGGTDTVTRTVWVAYNMSSILQPVNDTGHGANPSVFKYGSTIPVKVEVTDCDGSHPSNLVLKLTTTVTSSTTPPGESEVASTSAADSGNQMRFSDPIYIFNLSSKSVTTDSSSSARLFVSLMNGSDVMQSTSALIGFKK
jgi:methionine-rich copper-binding protein CopC